MKLTPWYPPRTHPSRIGYYDRKYSDGVYRHYWNGEYWAQSEHSAPHWRQVNDYPVWRGLAEPPREEK